MKQIIEKLERIEIGICLKKLEFSQNNIRIYEMMESFEKISEVNSGWP